MTSDDPFLSPQQSDDRTIIRPTPGGKRSDLRNPPPPPSNTSSRIPSLPRLGRLNPLEKASSGLLALLTRLNTSKNQSDPVGLKNKIIKEIQQFQLNAQACEIDPDTISSSRYVLCTVLDEAVLSTPWGNSSGWSQQSLLSLFHKEVSGGERFFDLLKSLAQNPTKNRNLLELMYLCLALGFEGRYRIIENGKDKLLSIREWLYRILQKERGIADTTLSPHWEGVTDRRNPLIRLIPLWVFGALAASLLAIMFSVFLFKLNSDSDPVFTQIFSIKPAKTEVVETQPEPLPEPKLSLSNLLFNEISQHLVKVIESSRQGTITIQGDNLFSSGSTAVNQNIIPLLNRIAESLNQLQGQIVITGHSDNVPIRSARYPSNWHLSQARAESVADVIKQKLLSPDRIVIEGKSDLEPVASNATPEGRSKNRRVVITLLNN
ncbi:MAG: type VI secretion system protein TssL, long form [Methylococcales bacterium]|nr:type VI secretion system protein TssL, long form [Methylococcales bacterium]